MGYLRTNSTLIDNSRLITSEGAYVWYAWDGEDKTSSYQFVASDNLKAYPFDGKQDGKYYRIYNLPKGASNYTWSELQTICKAELADEAVSLGDTKTLTSAYVSGNITAKVIEINPWNILFAMYISKTINMIGINEVQGWLNKAVLDSFYDEDFKPSLQKAPGLYGYDRYGSMVTLDDEYKYLWLFTEIELWGKKTYGSVSSGSQFELFKINKGNAYTSSPFWLRSATDYITQRIDGWCYSDGYGSASYTESPTTDYKGSFVGFYVG